MMGRTHALTGLAAGIGGAYLAKVGIGQGLAGVALCTGAAILPDIDHPRSTVSNVYGPVTGGFCWIMNKITGGHRRGTHSLPGIFALGVLAQAGVAVRANGVPARGTSGTREYMISLIPYAAGTALLCLTMILCLAGAIRLLKIPGWLDDFAPIPVVLGVVYVTPISLEWVPVAVMLGCVIHVVGDVVTLTGCPLFWPFSQANTKLALFKTNGFTERNIVTPLVIVAIIAELVCVFYFGVDSGH